MHHLAQSAPDGQVLPLAEALACDPGRLLLADTLRAAVQQRVAAAEQKGGPPAAARAPGGCACRGGTPATC